MPIVGFAMLKKKKNKLLNPRFSAKEGGCLIFEVLQIFIAMHTEKLMQTFGVKASNRLDKANVISIEGAIACLESFYYAFNNKDIEVLKDVWYNSELAQINNPQH